jgi:outer membrane protein
MWLLMFRVWARPLSVEDALDQALQNNLELAQRRLDNAVVRHRLTQARGAFDPRLLAGINVDQRKTPSNAATDVGTAQAVVTSSSTSWNVGLNQALPTGGTVNASLTEFQTTTDSTNALSSRFISRQVGVGLNQPLLRGIGIGALTQLRDAQLDQAAQELVWQSQLEATVIAVSGAYWGLVSAREQQAIAQRGVDLAQAQLAETRERLDAGFAGSGDVLQVQVLVGQAQRSLVNATADMASAEDALARLLGLPLAEAPDLQPTDVPEVPEGLPERAGVLAEAQQRNASLGIARVNLERAERAARRGKNGTLPDLGLNANASWSAGGDDPQVVRSDLFQNPAPSYGMGLTVGLPIVPRQAFATFATSSIAKEQATLAFEAAQQDLEVSVARAVRAMDRDRAGLVAAVQTLEFARLSLEAQQELLGEGRGSTRDVVDSLEALRAAEAAELNAKIALQLSVLQTEQIAGTLVGPPLD